jgi:hypothetical protein
MQIMPVSPVVRAGNDTRPARDHAMPYTCKARTEPATPAQSRASVVLELYGAPATFGTFERYGNFSAKV